MTNRPDSSLAPPPPSGGCAGRSVDFSKLDAEGRSLMFRAGDIKARFLLLDRSERLYKQGQKRAACALIHALEYLKDRLAYELSPWPRNCVPHDFGDPQRYELPQQGPARGLAGTRASNASDLGNKDGQER